MLHVIYDCCDEPKTTQELAKRLKKDGIGWKQILPLEIEKMTEIRHGQQEALVLCDKRKTAERLRQSGWFVIVVCHEKNREEDFFGFPYAVEEVDELETDFFIKVWQRFTKRPWHIVDTSRCEIREMTEDDLDDLYQIYQDPEITRYMEGLFEDREMERDYIRNYIRNIYMYFGFGTWMIIRKSDGKLIGRAGLNYRVGFEEPELGFMLGKEYQKQGYAYEVCSCILTLAKEAYGFEKIQALAEPENISSIKLLKKLGFVYTEEVTLEQRKYQRFLYDETKRQEKSL